MLLYQLKYLGAAVGKTLFWAAGIYWIPFLISRFLYKIEFKPWRIWGSCVFVEVFSQIIQNILRKQWLLQTLIIIRFWEVLQRSPLLPFLQINLIPRNGRRLPAPVVFITILLFSSLIFHSDYLKFLLCEAVVVFVEAATNNRLIILTSEKHRSLGFFFYFLDFFDEERALVYLF